MADDMRRKSFKTRSGNRTAALSEREGKKQQHGGQEKKKKIEVMKYV